MTLPFGSSQRSTIGVEWELQLVDRDSHDLRQSADAIIDRATTDGKLYPGIHREMLLNTIEVVSKPRSTVAECMADLTDCVDYLTPLASDLRIDLATAGTHPFARPGRQRVTDSERYAQLVERTAYWGHQMLLYGVHVHVGVEDRAKILPIQAALTAHLGHLQAISASSPFWAGEDTGYASNRAMVFQQLPTAGIPRQFDDVGGPGGLHGRHDPHGRHRGLRRGPLGHPPLAGLRHDREPRVRRGDERYRGRHLRGLHPRPRRALLAPVRRRRAAALPAGLVRRREQVALGPLRHGRDPHRLARRRDRERPRRHRAPEGRAGSRGRRPWTARASSPAWTRS